jgi:DNA-binding transcriptional ArsR family regulator
MEKEIYSIWADILKTIGHPIRIKIIEVLLDNDKCVSSISGSLDLPQATVSEHLSVFRTKGIVQNKRCGSRVKYSINDGSIEEIVRLIKSCELT